MGSYSLILAARLLLNANHRRDDQAAAANAIRGINSGGNTSIGASLITGRDRLLAGGDDNHAWAIVFVERRPGKPSPGITSVLPSIASTKDQGFSPLVWATSTETR